ncbi:MAG: HAD family hydrolase [Muribaculaceae bacterium]|nr:HAD family hydrolase [Muribaculaceae bacterium]
MNTKGEAMLIAFDMDDTLYKEREYVFSGRRAVARYFSEKTGLPETQLTGAMEGYGPVGPEAFDALYRVLEPHGILMEEIVQVYRAHRPEISLDPDAEALLQRLKDAGMHLALITDGRPAGQRMKFEALGLGRFFEPDSVFISGETGGSKNTPLPFRMGEERFPEARRRIYVGDNMAKDFRNARMRGWQTVMLADPEKKNIFPQMIGEAAPEYRPDMVVFRLSDAFPQTI